jgi:hypothetical protein
MASSERVAVPRRGKAERFASFLRVLLFFENFFPKRVKHKYKCDNAAFLVEDACYFDFFIFSRSTREITQTTSRDLDHECGAGAQEKN